AARPEQQVVQVDVDVDELGRNHERTLGVLGDARVTLERLLERLREEGPPRASRAGERRELRERIAATATDEPQASLLAALRAGTPREAICVPDMTQLGYYANAFWPVYEPRTYLTTSFSGNLGSAFPLALGAK